MGADDQSKASRKMLQKFWGSKLFRSREASGASTNTTYLKDRRASLPEISLNDEWQVLTGSHINSSTVTVTAAEKQASAFTEKQHTQRNEVMSSLFKQTGGAAGESHTINVVDFIDRLGTSSEGGQSCDINEEDFYTFFHGMVTHHGDVAALEKFAHCMISAWNLKLGDMRTALMAEQKKVAGLTEDLSKQRRRNRETRSTSLLVLENLDAMDGEIFEAENEVRTLQRTSSMKDREITQLQSDIVQLARELHEVQMQLQTEKAIQQELRAEKNQVDIALASTTAVNSELAGRISELTANQERVDWLLAKSQSDFDDLFIIHDDLEKRSTELEAQTAKLRAENETLQQSYAALQHDYLDESENFQKTVEALLMKDVPSARTPICSDKPLADEIMKCSASNSSSHDPTPTGSRRGSYRTMEALVSEISALQSDRAQYFDSCEKLKGDLQDLQNRHDTLRLEMTSDLGNVRTQLQDANNKLLQLEHERSAAVTQYDKLKQKMGTITARNSDYRRVNRLLAADVRMFLAHHENDDNRHNILSEVCLAAPELQEHQVNV